MKDSDSDNWESKLVKKAVSWSVVSVLLGAVLAHHHSYLCSKADFVLAAALLGVIVVLYLDATPRPTYLLDFACYRPPDHDKISKAEFVDLARRSGSFPDSALEFQEEVLRSSGIGDESYVPRVVFRRGHSIGLSEGREEAAAAMCGAVDAVLAATGVGPAQVGVLVVNCGVLNTTPSLAAMLINHYKLGCNVQSFNLGGMGCSAGVVAIEVAADLLKVHSEATYALVVSTEAVSFTWYKGPDPDKLLPNCFVRSGAAAVMLSGARRHRCRAKYRLRALQRAISAGSGSEIRMAEDGAGTMGVSVGPRVVEAVVSGIPKEAPESEHVCVSAMGKQVLDAVQEKLGFSEAQMEASRKTLERFGNQSSSSMWYELAYLERHQRVKTGHRVWQIAFGSGMKCNTMLWEALRNTKPPPTQSPTPWDP